MLEKVFNYIKEHPSCQVLDIVDALENTSMLHVLAATRELIEKGFVRSTWTTAKESSDEVMLLSVAKESFVDDKNF